MLNRDTKSSLRKTRRNKKVALLALASLALGGCMNGAGLSDLAAGQTKVMPYEKFPIHVVPTEEEMTLMVPAHATTVNQEDRARIASFASAYKHVGHGEMWIIGPSGSQNAAVSVGASAEISKILIAQGLSVEQIKRRSYQSSAENSPITIRFKRFDTVTSACRNWQSNVAFSPMNGSTPNFGCATQSNIAVLVEDPHDLLAPRTMGNADADRRSTVIDRYRAGQPTSTTRSGDESGTVSDVQ